jgi:dihydropteroate synthase-like protein
VADRPRVLFVTGRLAEPALRRVVADAAAGRFEPVVVALPITVAALLTTNWVGRHLSLPPDVKRVILPGFCRGEAASLAEKFGVPFEHGPKDLHDLPEYLGSPPRRMPTLDGYDIEIIAEINHAPRLALETILSMARRYRRDGADVIDLGCDPGETWTSVGETVAALSAEGFRVSIDSFNTAEIAPAARAGAELVLSVNGNNVEVAADWGIEVVAIPDDPATMAGLDSTLDTLERGNVRYRIDPILEPIGFGFAASLGRYLQVRGRYPGAAMMMGVGNLTELTDVDSAGVNVMLAGFCQEVGVHSVLTTEVINWCRSCVRELDLARRLVYTAARERVLPKRLCPDLVTLRDPKLTVRGEEELSELAARVGDRNYRILAERGEVHVINGHMHLRGRDPFALFDEILRRDRNLDAPHAFYLGYELAKAVTALTVGKNYAQDQALRWGFLTLPEEGRHRGR